MADTSSSQIWRASTTAPVNIAIIKYWGKRDSQLNLPTNSSLSVTLNQADLRTLTTASCSARFPHDTLLLNNRPQDISTPRTQACLRALRQLRAAVEAADRALPKLASLPLKLVSSNNFPTAAGLASSAAGFAALVRAVADLYGLPQGATQLSVIARQGSGSACRSLLGGYVAWNMGSADDGTDSMAEQVAPAAYWPSMRALILVVSAAAKDVPSTAGMQTTVATSELFAARARDVVPARMESMREAIYARDFARFATLTMRDSNSFHATCLDTWPPICYLTDVSRAAIKAVEAVNAAAGALGPVAAYTFDAGPNAVIYYEDKDAAMVEGVFRGVLGHVEGWKGDREMVSDGEGKGEVKLAERVAAQLRDGVTRVILTSVGEGPVSVDTHLVDEQGEAVQTTQ